VHTGRVSIGPPLVMQLIQKMGTLWTVMHASVKVPPRVLFNLSGKCDRSSLAIGRLYSWIPLGGVVTTHAYDVPLMCYIRACTVALSSSRTRLLFVSANEGLSAEWGLESRQEECWS
jgi:hypothetical protein